MPTARTQTHYVMQLLDMQGLGCTCPVAVWEAKVQPSHGDPHQEVVWPVVVGAISVVQLVAAVGGCP